VKNTTIKHLVLDGNPIKDREVLKLIKDELTINKDPHILRTKKDQLLTWRPMKVLLNSDVLVLGYQ